MTLRQEMRWVYSTMITHLGPETHTGQGRWEECDRIYLNYLKYSIEKIKIEKLHWNDVQKKDTNNQIIPYVYKSSISGSAIH